MKFKRSHLRSRAWKILLVPLLTLVALVLVAAFPSVSSADSGSDMHLAALPALVFFDNMEYGPGSWTATGTWAITTEYANSPTHSWSDSPGGDYANDSDSSLTSGIIDLSAVTPGQYVTLYFVASIDLESGDRLYIDFTPDNGANWSSAPTSITGHFTNESFGVAIPTEMQTSQFRTATSPPMASIWTT
jgi:hypothetical protein